MASNILYSNRVFLRLLFNYHFRRHPSLSLFSTLNVNKNQTKDEEVIKIPKRVHRGPTDILKALAEITQRDLSGPDYRYLDDPFLTPLSGNQKRVFSLAQESGRRAAKYVFDEFPDLFYRDDSEPKIEAFTYKDVYDENTEVDETDLQKCIARKEVNHSIVCYKNLKRDSKQISSENKQKLLELVSFYNCDEPPDLEFVTEKIFMKQSEIPRILWKDNGFAEQLFDSIGEKTSESYCALIQGMAKYSQSQKAFQYYQEMFEKGLKMNVETYNSLLKITPLLRESTDSRWMFIEDILNSMNNNGIKPNLHTMNNILEVITRFGLQLRFANNWSKKTLVEMTNKLGIKPSLATYNHLLNIFYKDKGPVTSALYEIIDRIETQEFEIQDPNDVQFFVNAMSICSNRLQDVSIAYRIHKMVENPKNNKLLGNILSESNYFQSFFLLLSNAEDINKFMNIYKTYVPHVYIPEPKVFSEIFRSIALYDAYDYLPKLWMDYKNFEYVTNVKLTEELFSLLREVNTNEELVNRCTQMVTEAINIIEYRLEYQKKEGHIVLHQFTGQLLGSAIDVYLNNKDIKSAIKTLNRFNNTEDVVGNPSPQTLIRLCLKLIDEKIYPMAKYCVQLSLKLSLSEVGVQVLENIRQSDLDQNIKDMFEEMSQEIELLSNKPTDDLSIEDQYTGTAH